MKKKLSFENLSILIVDDVKSMRSIVRSMLKNLKIGQTPHMAENGLEALRMMHASRIDLVITDWKMPIMSGAQLLEAIRSDRDLRDTPVLMVTAESEKDIVLEAAEIEVDAYLLKPLTPAVLEEKIATIIQQINEPEKATLHIKKARQLEENNDIETAIKHLKRAIQLKPGASRILRNIGLLYQKTGNEAAFEKFLLKAASANPQDAVTRYLLGQFYREKNKLLPATLYFHEMIVLTRKFTDDAIELGQELLMDQQLKNARQLFSGIIARMPKNMEVVEKILDICIEYGEFPFALNLLKKTRHDFPGNYDLVYKTACICEMMDDLDIALEHFLTVDKNQYGRIDVKLKIAKIYHQKKKSIQADNFLNAILRIDSKNKDALKLRRQI